jgi:hypothetical protein
LGEISEGDKVRKNVRRYASCTGNALVRKSAFEAVQGFDETILVGWEDWDFIRRLRAKGFKCWYTPNALVHHVVPLERLEEPFFKWHAIRAGAGFASRDLREWGLARTVVLCIARIGQAACVNMPLLVWARVMCNKEELLTRKCLLLKAVSYTRNTLFFVSPRLFSQDRFHARIQLRNELRYAREDERLIEESKP